MSTVTPLRKSRLELKHEIHSVLLLRLLCTVSAARTEPPSAPHSPAPCTHVILPTTLKGALLQFTFTACDCSRFVIFYADFLLVTETFTMWSQGLKVKTCSFFMSPRTEKLFLTGKNFSGPAASSPTLSAASPKCHNHQFLFIFYSRLQWDKPWIITPDLLDAALCLQPSAKKLLPTELNALLDFACVLKKYEQKMLSTWPQTLENESDCWQQFWPPGGDTNQIADRWGAEGRLTGWNFSISRCLRCPQVNSHRLKETPGIWGMEFGRKLTNNCFPRTTFFWVTTTWSPRVPLMRWWSDIFKCSGQKIEGCASYHDYIGTVFSFKISQRLFSMWQTAPEQRLGLKTCYSARGANHCKKITFAKWNIKTN